MAMPMSHTVKGTATKPNMYGTIGRAADLHHSTHRREERVHLPHLLEAADEGLVGGGTRGAGGCARGCRVAAVGLPLYVGGHAAEDAAADGQVRVRVPIEAALLGSRSSG